MHLIWNGIVQAFELLIHGNPLVYSIALRTLQVSVPSICIALLIGVPSAAASRSRGFAAATS